MDDWEINQARANYEAYIEQILRTARAEIINGERVDWPQRSHFDSVLSFNASFWIESYLQEQPRGRTFRPAPRFLLRENPLTMRVPDVAFLSTHKLAQEPVSEVMRIAPDLIVEILGDPSRRQEVDQRIADFFRAGTDIAWIVDPDTNTCTVRRRRGEERVFRYNQKVYSAPVLPRLCLRVYELFGE